MSPMNQTIALKYLIDKLDPDSKAELQQLLGGGDLPDLGQDALRGRLAMDRLPPRIKRRAIQSVAPDRSGDVAAFGERYPDASRIRSL